MLESLNFFLVFLSLSFASPLVKPLRTLVCPLSDENAFNLIAFRSDLLCKSSAHCLLKKEFKRETYSTDVVLINDGWPKNFQTLANISSNCDHIRFVPLDIAVINRTAISGICSSTLTTLIFITSNLSLNISAKKSKLQGDCFVKEIVDPSDNVLSTFLPMCPNTIWINGADKCGESSFATKILRYDKDEDMIADRSFGKYYIRNKNLTIGVVQNPPYMFKNENDEYDGLLVQMLQKIAINLHFTYSFKEPSDNFYGMEINGTWNGLIEQLLVNETDLAVADLTATYSRSSVVEFSSPYFYEMIGIMIHKDTFDVDLWKMFSLFSKNVWIAITVCSTVSVMVLYALHRMSAVPLDSKLNQFGRCVWFGTACLSNQGHEDMPLTWSVQNFMVLWWLYVFALLSVYSGGLIAVLTTNRLTLPFTDLKGLSELVRAGKYKICVEDSTAFHATIMSGDEDYVNLKNFLLKNPKFVGENTCPQITLDNRDLAYLEEVQYLLKVQRSSCREASYIILADKFFPGFFAFAFRKKSLYNAIISQEITSIVEAGLVSGWRKAFTRSETSKLCQIIEPTEFIHADTKALTISEFTGPLCILLIGFLLGLFRFIYEIFTLFQMRKKLLVV